MHLPWNLYLNVGKHKIHRFLYMGNGGSEHMFFSQLAPKEWPFFLAVKNIGQAAGSAFSKRHFGTTTRGKIPTWEEHFNSPK